MFDLGTIGAVVTLDDQPFRSTMAGLPGHSGAAMTQVYSHMVRALGAAGAIKLFKDAGKAAADYGAELANIASVAPELDMSKVRASISGLDSELGKSAALAGSYYYAYSAGMRGNEEELARFTGQMAQLAMTVRADQVPVMDAATTLMNAYGKGVKEAAEVSDWFFTVVKQGKTTGQELAASLPLVASTAATFGVELNQLGASIAILTRTQSTGQAMSSLAQMLKSIANPTKEAKDLAAAHGVELSASALKAKGLAGVLAEVREKLDGNTDALAKIFPDMEGFRGVAALTGSQFEDFTNVLGEFENKAGSSTSAFRRQMESSAAVWEKALVDVNKAYVAFGQSFAPVTDAMARGISVIANGAETLSDNGVAAGIAAAAVGVMAWQAGKLVMQMLQVPGAVLSASRAITANAGAVSAETAAVSTNTLAWKANAYVRGTGGKPNRYQAIAGDMGDVWDQLSVKSKVSYGVESGKMAQATGSGAMARASEEAFAQDERRMLLLGESTSRVSAKTAQHAAELAKAEAAAAGLGAKMLRFGAAVAPLAAIAAELAIVAALVWEVSAAYEICTAKGKAMAAAERATAKTEAELHAKRKADLGAKVDAMVAKGDMSQGMAKNYRERIEINSSLEKDAPAIKKIMAELAAEEAKAKPKHDREDAKEKGYERDVQESQDRAATLKKVEADNARELAAMKAGFLEGDGELDMAEQQALADKKLKLQEDYLRRIDWMRSDYAKRAADSTDKKASAQYSDFADQLAAGRAPAVDAWAEAKTASRQAKEQAATQKETREVADLRSSYIMGNGGKMDAAGEWQTNQKQLGQSQGRLSDIEAQIRKETNDEVIRTLRDRKNKEVEIYAGLVKQKEELDPKKQAAKLQNEVFKDTLEGEGSVRRRPRRSWRCPPPSSRSFTRGCCRSGRPRTPEMRSWRNTTPWQNTQKPSTSKTTSCPGTPTTW